jgi:hypothetical protein
MLTIIILSCTDEGIFITDFFVYRLELIEKEGQSGMTVLTDRSEGGSSLEDGHLGRAQTQELSNKNLPNANNRLLNKKIGKIWKGSGAKSYITKGFLIR